MKKYFFGLLALIFFQIQSFAQNDTGFVSNYKQFRAIVDPLPTYTIYMVPFQSKEKILINESEVYIKEAYHFLREKTTKKNRASFIVGVLIDDLVTDYPSYYTVQNSEKKTAYQVVITYRLSFNVIVYTAKGQNYHYNLCTQKEFKKESVLWVTNQVTDPWTTNKSNSLTDISAVIQQNKWVFPANNDYIKNFESVLKEYVNYYVDRVDW